jgi:putative hemolysin
LAKYEDPEALTAYLRQRTYLLAEKDTSTRSLKPFRFSLRSEAISVMPIADPVPPEAIQQEIRSLPPYSFLLAYQHFRVYFARSKYIPQTLREIGRLREITFRETGEGTGKSLDLDEFDQDYFHLFIWDENENGIVGSYRLGPVDIILLQKGLEGLYTYSLFRYDRRLIEQISPALEVGRSFILKSYQKQFAPLYLLWKGIAAFIARYPHYRFLFGPVSISNEYSTYSRQLLITFLEQYAWDANLSRLVKPKAPFSTFFLKWKAKKVVKYLYDLNDVSDVLKQLEKDMKGVPVLLRQYLNLGGKILAFNVDKEFSDVLDALICVDLLKTKRDILNRFFEPEQLRHFFDFHNQELSEVPSNEEKEA